MSTITAALESVAPRRTAGALPSSRTNDMVETALESDNIEAVKTELTHSRAHYQSLEFLLNDETAILESLRASIAAGEFPTPTTVDEALELAVRIYANVVIDAAYDNAHEVALPMAVLGLSVQESLQSLYSHLDHSDPERELTAGDLESLLDPNQG